MIITDPKVTLSGTSDDITEFVKTASFEVSRTDLDDTRSGSGGKVHRGGLVDGSLTLELADDFDATKLDAILWAIFNAGANVEARVRMTSAAISTNNPEWRMQVCPTGYSAGGAVDTLAAKSISWPISGGISRVTST